MKNGATQQCDFSVDFGALQWSFSVMAAITNELPVELNVYSIPCSLQRSLKQKCLQIYPFQKDFRYFSVSVSAYAVLILPISASDMMPGFMKV